MLLSFRDDRLLIETETTEMRQPLGEAESFPTLVTSIQLTVEEADRLLDFLKLSLPIAKERSSISKTRQRQARIRELKDELFRLESLS